MTQPEKGDAALARDFQEIALHLSGEGGERLRFGTTPSGLPAIRLVDGASAAGSDVSSAQMMRLLAARGCRLVLDLSDCPYLSSTDLGLIARIASVLEPRGGGIFVLGASRQAEKMIEMVGLGSVFTLCESRDDLPASTN